MATWQGSPTASQLINCEPPYSFYFDLIQTSWLCDGGNPDPFHRLCTLARKQGAKTVLISCGLNEPDVMVELDHLDAALGPGGNAQALRIAFFRARASGFDVGAASSSDLIGILTLINYTVPRANPQTISYVYEAIFRLPALPAEAEPLLLLNNFVYSDSKFDIELDGHKFAIEGVYYCQQNAVTHVCAHACMRMAINTLYPAARIAPQDINDKLKITHPAQGLSSDHMKQIINSADPKDSALVIPCRGQSTENFINNITAFVESGLVTLIGFTSGTNFHIVTCFGYTKNTDEWHPQAIQAYAGPSTAMYRPSALWTDHLIINDDNFGPYCTLSSRALEVDKNVAADIIIAIAPSGVQVYPISAESIASVFLLVYSFVCKRQRQMV